MKKPKRKMQKRDKFLILFIAAFGLVGAGYMLWINSMVDEWELDKRPADTQEQQQSGFLQEEGMDTFSEVEVVEGI